MPKSTDEVALFEPLDTMKPLVKDFIDTEKNLIDFISLRVPYQTKTTLQIKTVFVNKAKTVYRFRVNYWTEPTSDLINTGQIVKSLYVEVIETNGEYSLTDITGIKRY